MCCEAISHSCRQCRISQKTCGTDQVREAKCQWAHILIPIVPGLTMYGEGMTVLEKAGFDGEADDRIVYGWRLGLQHARRI